MNRVKPSIRSIIKCHGGKSYLCRRAGINLIDLFPDHDIFVEGCAGGLNALLNKPKSRVEVAADIDPTIANIWVSIISNHEELYSLLNCIGYTEENFNEALAGMADCDPILDPHTSGDMPSYCYAADSIIVNRFSRSGHGKDFAWSERLRGGQPGDVNAWGTFLEKEFHRCADRVSGVDFRFQDCLAMLKEFNTSKCFHYLDPPYPRETRVTKDAYQMEMPTLRDHLTGEERKAKKTTHEDIIDFVTSKKCKSKVLISSYPNNLYNDRLGKDCGWNYYTWDAPNNSGQTKVKQRRLEVVWGNYQFPTLREQTIRENSK